MMRRTIAALLLCLSASPAAALCPTYLGNDAFFACQDQERAIREMQFQMDQLRERQQQIEQERAKREGRIYIPSYRPLHLPW